MDIVKRISDSDHRKTKEYLAMNIKKKENLTTYTERKMISGNEHRQKKNI